ncbi:hypothetical protein TWF281_010747 [Arthrobotrys megalospora]
MIAWAIELAKGYIYGYYRNRESTTQANLEGTSNGVEIQGHQFGFYDRGSRRDGDESEQANASSQQNKNLLPLRPPIGDEIGCSDKIAEDSRDSHRRQFKEDPEAESSGSHCNCKICEPLDIQGPGGPLNSTLNPVYETQQSDRASLMPSGIIRKLTFEDDEESLDIGIVGYSEAPAEKILSQPSMDSGYGTFVCDPINSQRSSTPRYPGNPDRRVPNLESPSPRNLEIIQPGPLGPAKKDLSILATLQNLSGLVWGQVGFQHILWKRDSVSPTSAGNEKIRKGMISFRKMEKEDPIRFQQLICAFRAQSRPVKFRIAPLLSEDNLSLSSQTNFGEDYRDPTFLDERASKAKMIFFLLHLLIWREAACRRGRESSISSAILEADDPQGNSDAGNAGDHDGPTPNDNGDGIPENTTSEVNSKLKGKRKKGNLAGRREANQDDDEDDDDQPRKRRKKSISGQLACPFARAEPALHLKCLCIGRKNPSGVKEHLRRNHFGGKTPKGLLAAKGWDGIFDFCYPKWGPLPRPSPNVDMIELFANCVRWKLHHPPPEVRQEDRLFDYQRFKGSAAGNVNVAGHLTLLPDIEQTEDSEHIQTISDMPSQLTQGSIPGGLRTLLGLAGEFASIGQIPFDNNVPENSEVPSRASHLVSSGPLQDLSLDIRDLNISSSYGYGPSLNPDLHNWSTTLGISLTLEAAISKMAEPHFTWPLSNDMRSQLEQSSDFLVTDFGIDMSLTPEERYTLTVSSMDPAGDIFDPMTDFTMPIIHPMPLSLSSTTFPHPTLEVCGPQTLIPVDPRSIVLTKPPLDGQSNTLSVDPSSNATPIVPRSPQHRSSQSNSANSSPRKYLLSISRHPANPNSLEVQGYKKYWFEDFEDFEENFEDWLKSQFFDPMFGWDTMEFYNDHRGMKFTSLEEITNDLEGSFTHYRSTRASLYLVMKDKGKHKATDVRFMREEDIESYLMSCEDQLY